jgi:hypothetical protein
VHFASGIGRWCAVLVGATRSLPSTETPLISAIKAHTNLDRPEHIKEAVNLLEEAGLTWTFISNPKIVKNTWDATMVDVKVIWKELRGKSSLTLGDLNSFADMGRALRPDWM